MAQRRTMGMAVAGLTVIAMAILAILLLGTQRPLLNGMEQPGTEDRTTEVDTRTRLPVYLQGYQQGQLVCPDGELTGRVSQVILDPAAATVGAPGDCTLADMRQANPDAKFYAYLDVAAMRPVNPHQGSFQNTCADPFEEGRRFTVESENPRVAKNDQGQVVYPDYDYLVVADLSEEYADACVRAMERLLSEPSAPGAHSDAGPVHFDGVLLDDVSMTPAHDQDMSEIGQWGPWDDDTAYGRAMIDTVVHIDEGLDSAMGRDVPILINLGLNTEEPQQVELALELARTGAVVGALREFTVATGSGMPFTDYEMAQFLRVHQELTEAGMPVIQHDYSVPLRMVQPDDFAQGREIPSDAPCLKESAEDADVLKDAVAHRRILDHRMLLGHTLLARTRDSVALTATLSQAEPFCQTTAASSQPMAEDVDRASVREGDREIKELTIALNESAYALGSPRETNGIWHQRLSNGQVVLLNTRTDPQAAILYGHHYEVPGRSALIDRP